jgi:hypothetical protein
MRLFKAHKYVLQALLNGATLKSHRYLDGTKIYQLHPLDGPPETVRRATVDYLKKHHLINSNKKFPTATYLLTQEGKNLAKILE